MAKSCNELLADALDTLIQGDSHKVSKETEELLSLGLRLHRECPSIDSAFAKEFGQRLEQERLRRRVPQPRQSSVARLPWLPRLLRVSALVLCACSLLLVLAPMPWLIAVEAGLSQVITAIRGVQIEQRLRCEPLPSTLPPKPRRLADLGEARRAAGFSLREPAYLPEGFEFHMAQAIVFLGRPSIELNYWGRQAREWNTDLSGGSTGRNSPALRIVEMACADTSHETLTGLAVGPGSAEVLQLKGRPVLWVSGAYTGRGRWLPGGHEGLAVLEDGDVLIFVWTNFSRGETLRVIESMLR